MERCINVGRLDAILGVFTRVQPRFRRALVFSVTFALDEDDRKWRLVSTDNTEERTRLATSNVARGVYVWLYIDVWYATDVPCRSYY